MNHSQHINLTIKRMVNLGGGGKMLPSAYKQVEYLQSSGTQHIDTGVVATTNNLRIVTKINVLSRSTNDDRFFGSQNGSKCALVPWFFGSQGSAPLGLIAVGTYYYCVKVNTAYNTVYDIDVTANNGILSGSYCGYTINDTYSDSVANGLSLYIFSNNTGSVVTTRDHCNARFYLFQIYTQSVKRFDGIPCYRKSDNKPGMYDTITKQFFTNSGTGEFILGPET